MAWTNSPGDGYDIPVREQKPREPSDGTDFVPIGNVDSAAAIGRAVRLHRKASGLTQAQAAGLCGVGARFLSELERGKETAEIGKVLRVLRGLGLVLSIAPRGRGPR
jgi:y4mF family transcriptional regulator